MGRDQFKAGEELAGWARERGLPCEVSERDLSLGDHAVKVTIGGSVSAEFFRTTPGLIVIQGDQWRGDFAEGLPLPALTGLVAGMLGVPAVPPGWVAFDLTDPDRYFTLSGALDRYGTWVREEAAESPRSPDRRPDLAGEMYRQAEAAVGDPVLRARWAEWKARHPELFPRRDDGGPAVTP